MRGKAQQEQAAYQASLRKEQLKVDALERTLEQKVNSNSALLMQKSTGRPKWSETSPEWLHPALLWSSDCSQVLPKDLSRSSRRAGPAAPRPQGEQHCPNLITKSAACTGRFRQMDPSARLWPQPRASARGWFRLGQSSVCTYVPSRALGLLWFSGLRSSWFSSFGFCFHF